MHPLSATRRRDESKGYVNVILCWIVKVPRRTPIARHRNLLNALRGELAGKLRASVCVLPFAANFG